MSRREQVEQKMALELGWVRTSQILPCIVDAQTFADRISMRLRAEPDRVLTLVIEILEADPGVCHYVDFYGPSLRQQYHKHHYVVLEE